MASSHAGATAQPFPQLNANGDQLITIREACLMLRRSQSTLRRIINSGEILTFPCPVRPLILLSSIHAYLARQTGGKLKPPPKKLPAKAKRRKR